MGKISITINGSLYHEFSSTQSILEIIQSFGFKPDMVIVEHNNTILDRNTLDTSFCQHHDILEIVRYMGGGG